MNRYNLSLEEEQAIDYLKNDIMMNREKYKEIERKGEPTGMGTMHDIYKLNICEYSIILHLIDKLQDMLNHKVHYIKCIKCGCEVRVKRSDAKYCKKCLKRNRREK